MEHLPNIIFNDDEDEKKEKKTIEFEIKSGLVGGNESADRLIKPDERKIKRIDDLVIEKKELSKAPHPPVLPIPRMPEKAPHPPELPIPEKLTLKMRLHLFRSRTKENASVHSKEITQKIRRIDFLLIISIILIFISLLTISFGIYGYVNLKNTYEKNKNSFSDTNYIDMENFCKNKNYKDCPKYLNYITGLKYMEDKNYILAKESFSSLNDFYSSTYYINYIDGVQFIKNKDINSAKNSFSKSNNILNTEYYLKYINLIDEINSSNLNNINDCYDLEGHIEVDYISKYIDGKRFYNEGDFKRSSSVLEDASYVIDDAKTIILEAKYRYAKEAQLDGFIGTAYRLLNEIKDYKDVKTILESPIYYVINNWSYKNNNGFLLNLSFYESSDTCFHEVKNGLTAGFSYDTDATIYEYKVKNNIIYFKNKDNEYMEMYLIRSFAKDKLILDVNGTIFEMNTRA